PEDEIGAVEGDGRRLCHDDLLRRLTGPTPWGRRGLEVLRRAGLEAVDRSERHRGLCDRFGYVGLAGLLVPDRVAGPTGDDRADVEPRHGDLIDHGPGGDVVRAHAMRVR